ncbi:MAG: hypothetical protein K9G58_12975 [Bacteroidales bacterium]|nr:hypothetical protein [Bacteroidales bacterium]MCF8399081.1 hypothetical protein [Bacteroidales bacterium]
MRLFEKYLVPSKPVFSPDTLHMVIEGKDPNVSAFKGIFQSFSDSPNGFKGEMQEIIHKLGLEARIESSDIFYVALRFWKESFGFNLRSIFKRGQHLQYAGLKLRANIKVTLK